MIDVVIPTMWMSNNFIDSLETYTNHSQINKIIIIDNNKSHRPNANILNHHKIDLISYVDIIPVLCGLKKKSQKKLCKCCKY